MLRKPINTLVLDLDNTIFDWFAVWYASFEPIYSEVIRITGKSTEEIEEDIRRVHQARRTSEYTFLLEELDVLKDLRAHGDIREQFERALEHSRHGRDKELKLYPSVFKSLWDIKQSGTKIVAYTESMGFYSAYRLKRFGLDGVIDVLFSPEDHDIPAGVSLNKMRHLPDDFYDLQVTEVQHTPPGELKPNPRVLLDILSAVDATASRCAYVGDSLFKDVAMARDVGAFDIHAEYGESQRRPEYALLQRVSHWTQEDVEREKEIVARGHNFKPSATLKDCFAEIFRYCDFEPFSEATISRSETKAAIEIWKKSVDVQQHFNDLELRIRNFAITIVGALIAAVGFTYQQGLQYDLFGHHFAAGTGLIVAAFFAWTAFLLMDRFWYHVLLKGAVTHAGKIEATYEGKIPGIGLGRTISEVSGKVRILGFTMNSNRRLAWFYVLGYLMLGVILMTLILATPSQHTVSSTRANAPASQMTNTNTPK